MNDPFRREVLLSTSRIVWPAEPVAERTVITIRAESRRVLGHAVLALVAFGHEAEAAPRLRFLDALAHAVDPRGAPRRREIESALRPGLHRLAKALEIARRAPFDPQDAARALADARSQRRVAWAAPVRARDVLARDLRPAMPMLHLALPILGSRNPELSERFPELVPAAIPATVVGLIESDAWPFLVIDSAERWRQALAMPELLEVRGRWLQD